MMDKDRKLSDEQETIVAERYRRGEFIQEIADDLGVGRKAIGNALRRQGCPKRDKRQAQEHLYGRRRAAGLPHQNWKGGRHITGDGYVLVAITDDDPMWAMVSQKRSGMNFGRGYILEHRLVMARALGRPIVTSETVHHKDGNRANNAVGNLQLRHGKHGGGIALCCAECGSVNIVAVPIGS